MHALNTVIQFSVCEMWFDSSFPLCTLYILLLPDCFQLNWSKNRRFLLWISRKNTLVLYIYVLHYSVLTQRFVIDVLKYRSKTSAVLDVWAS